MKQKEDISQTEPQFASEPALLSVVEENVGFESLGASLAEIRKLKGVLGYILRNSSSAIIDFTQADKIIEYALLSSQILDSSREIAKQLSFTETKTVIVEGKNVKVLCMSVGENNASVFMEKTANHAWIIKRIFL